MRSWEGCSGERLLFCMLLGKVSKNDNLKMQEKEGDYFQ